MFKNPFSFSGRIRRTEYWFSMFLVAILNMFGSVLMQAGKEAGAGAVVIGFFWIFFVFFFFALPQNVKRCHDIGVSGWCAIIPLFGLLLLFIPGQKGKNRYGDDPKQEYEKNTSEQTNSYDYKKLENRYTAFPEQNQNTYKLKNKYSILIHKIMSRAPLYQLHEIDINNVRITNVGMVFHLTETASTLQIVWEWDRGHIHRLAWYFDQYQDQNKMYEIISKDMAVQNLIDDGMSQSQANDFLEVSNCKDEEEKKKLFENFVKKYPDLF